MERLTLLTISPLLEDRFGRSLRFYHLEFDKEASSDVVGVIPRSLGVFFTFKFILECF